MKKYNLKLQGALKAKKLKKGKVDFDEFEQTNFQSRRVVKQNAQKSGTYGLRPANITRTRPVVKNPATKTTQKIQRLAKAATVRLDANRVSKTMAIINVSVNIQADNAKNSDQIVVVRPKLTQEDAMRLRQATKAFAEQQAAMMKSFLDKNYGIAL